MNKELPPKADVVIIGAGLVGTSIAYQLAKRGVTEVVVLEKGHIGAEGATANCVGGIRTQFSTEINILFSLVSREVFRNFKLEFGIDPGWIPLGYLFLAGDDRIMEVLEQTAGLMTKLSLPIELLSPELVAERWPFLRTDEIVGASHTKDDGFYSPHEVVQAYAKGARHRGVIIREMMAVNGVDINGMRVSGVRIADGRRVDAEVVVNAAGPWSGQVAGLANLDLPIGPLRRHLFFTDVFEELPEIFPYTVDLKSGWYIKREGRGLLLGGPSGGRSFSKEVDFDAEEWTAIKSMERVPVLRRASIARGWVGHYELSPDHHAVIGSFPELPNFICAGGFSGHGFQHSPACGIVVAELITKGHPETIDIHALRPTRFREEDLNHEPLTAFRE